VRLWNACENMVYQEQAGLRMLAAKDCKGRGTVKPWSVLTRESDTSASTPAEVSMIKMLAAVSASIMLIVEVKAGVVRIVQASKDGVRVETDVTRSIWVACDSIGAVVTTVISVTVESKVK